jgi:hypothetical protein
MIRTITMLVVAALLMLALAVPAFADSPNKQQCEDKGGTFDSATKVCTYPVGKSGKTKTATFHDAGQGDQIARTNPNGKPLP